MLWFTGYNTLPIQVTKSIIYWSHMQWIYGIDELINFAESNNLSVGVVNVSDWQKRISQGVVDHLKNRHQRTIQMTIPNPVFDEILNEVKLENLQKKKGKFIFMQHGQQEVT